MENSNLSNLVNNTRVIVAPPVDIPLFVTVIFVVLGITGNILVCLAVALDKSLQTLSNLFLCSLAVTDLLISVVVLPVRRIMQLTELEPSQFVWCLLYVTVDDFLTAASAIHICSISVERYLAIKNPMNVTRMSKGRTVKRILAVWLTSLLGVLPLVVIACISDYSQTNSYCSYVLGGLTLFRGIVISEALIIAIMVVIVCYSFLRTVTILYKLTRKQKSQKDGDSGMIRSVGGANKCNKVNQLKHLNTEMKALQVVWIVSFAFILAMGPYAAVSISFLINEKLFIPPIIITLTSYLNYSNSVINPILYTFFNRQFREKFWHILTFQYKKV